MYNLYIKYIEFFIYICKINLPILFLNSFLLIILFLFLYNNYSINIYALDSKYILVYVIFKFLALGLNYYKL